MQMIVLGSGSDGNGYLLKASNGETLAIEAGVHLSELADAMDHNFDNVVGCIISHRHGDHAGWVKNYMDAGIDCYMNGDTIEGMELSGHKCREIKSTVQFTLGNFKIKPLSVEHGVPCLAFLIDHPESGRCFFLTDSSYCKWNLSKAKINNWLVECNYILEKMQANITAGKIPGKVADHIITGHFSLENCLSFFEANDLSHTVRIVTLHISSKNGDSKVFKREIQRATGKEVLVAKKGLVINNFGPNPF